MQLDRDFFSEFERRRKHAGGDLKAVIEGDITRCLRVEHDEMVSDLRGPPEGWTDGDGPRQERAKNRTRAGVVADLNILIGNNPGTKSFVEIF